MTEVTTDNTDTTDRNDLPVAVGGVSIFGKFSVSELHWKFQELTEIGRITVVMYVSDHFFSRESAVHWLSGPEYKVGVLGGDKIRITKTSQKNAEI